MIMAYPRDLLAVVLILSGCASFPEMDGAPVAALRAAEIAHTRRYDVAELLLGTQCVKTRLQYDLTEQLNNRIKMN